MIEAIAANQPIEIKRLSDLLKVPLPTVYRFISVLEEKGYIVKAAGNGKYQLGMSFVNLAAIVLKQFRLADVLHPSLEEIAGKTRETVYFQIRQGADSVCVDCVESQQPVRLAMRIGEARPLYAGAGQRVLLAYQKEDEREAIINSLTLKKIGPKTLTSKEELRKRITLILKRGYDISEEELTEGTRAIAVPVFDSIEQIFGVITVSGLKYRMGEKELMAALEILKRAAKNLSPKLPLDLMFARR